jgi:hypothetical protein
VATVSERSYRDGAIMSGVSEVAAEFRLAGDGSDSLRFELHSGPSCAGIAANFMRGGLCLIVLFEMVCFAAHFYFFPASGPEVMPFEIFNLISGFVCTGLTWTLWFQRHWRAASFAFSAAVVLGATSISLTTAQTEPLFMATMLLLVGSGSLVPWNARWQAALTLLCLSWLALNALWAAPSPTENLFRWLALLAAAGLAHYATAMRDHGRREGRSRD